MASYVIVSSLMDIAEAMGPHQAQCRMADEYLMAFNGAFALLQWRSVSRPVERRSVVEPCGQHPLWHIPGEFVLLFGHANENNSCCDFIVPVGG